MHTYIHTNIHTYIHTYIHMCVYVNSHVPHKALHLIKTVLQSNTNGYRQRPTNSVLTSSDILHIDILFTYSEYSHRVCEDTLLLHTLFWYTPDILWILSQSMWRHPTLSWQTLSAHTLTYYIFTYSSHTLNTLTEYAKTLHSVLTDSVCTYSDILYLHILFTYSEYSHRVCEDTPFCLDRLCLRILFTCSVVTYFVPTYTTVYVETKYVIGLFCKIDL